MIGEMLDMHLAGAAIIDHAAAKKRHEIARAAPTEALVRKDSTVRDTGGACGLIVQI